MAAGPVRDSSKLHVTHGTCLSGRSEGDSPDNPLLWPTGGQAHGWEEQMCGNRAAARCSLVGQQGLFQGLQPLHQGGCNDMGRGSCCW